MREKVATIAIILILMLKSREECMFRSHLIKGNAQIFRIAQNLRKTSEFEG